MAIKFHRCSSTFIKGPHPCWRAQKALDEAGIEYELVLHSACGRAGPRSRQMTGQRKLPFIEFEDGTILHESTEIAARRARRHAGADSGCGLTASRPARVV